MICKVNDRIAITRAYDGMPPNSIIGSTGTIIEAYNDSIAVEFDEDVGGHDLDHRVKRGHGWWIYNSHYSCIEIIEDERATSIDVSDYL